MWNNCKLAGASFHYVMSHLNSYAYDTINLYCIALLMYLDFCSACCSSNDNSSCLLGAVPAFVTFFSFLAFAQTGGF